MIARIAGSWEWVVEPTVATSLLGYVLLRCQRRWQIFGRNNFTPRSIENYLFGNLGAFALILPGFLSDIFGLIIIIPHTRRILLAAFKMARFDLYERAKGSFSVFRTYSFHSDRHYPNQSASFYDDDTDDTIDVVARDVNSEEQSQARDAIDVEFTVRD